MKKSKKSKEKHLSFNKTSKSHKINTNKLSNLFLSLISGLLLTLALPESLSPFLAWFALAPLISVLIHNKSAVSSFLLSFLAAFIYTLKVYHSISVFGPPPWIALALMQASFIGIWGLVLHLSFTHLKIPEKFKILLPPLLWLIYEYLRGSGPLALNWGSLAYTQYKFIPFIQIASVTGIFGPLFLILLSNSIIAFLFNEYNEFKKKGRGSFTLSPILRIYILIFVTFFALAVIWGSATINSDKAKSENAEKITFSVIQPAVPMHIKNNPYSAPEVIRKLYTMTMSESRNNPDIIFWPETSMPARLPEDTRALKTISELAKTARADLVIGSTHFDSAGNLYNCAHKFDNSGLLQKSYAKQHLVPFGEYLPAKKYLRPIPLFNRVMNYSKGDKNEIFTLNGVNFGILICFESDFARYFRESTKLGAQFIAVITNDGWFEYFPAAEHHISWDVFRAVENRINIVQTANTGISGLIDYNGRIHNKTKLFEEKSFTSHLSLIPAGSLYTKFGNIFFFISLLTTAAIFIHSFIVTYAGKSKENQ